MARSIDTKKKTSKFPIEPNVSVVEVSPIKQKVTKKPKNDEQSVVRQGKNNSNMAKKTPRGFKA